METEMASEVPLSAKVSVTPAIDNGQASKKEVDGETLCQIIAQARYKATWCDPHRGDWGYRQTVPDDELVRETNWHLAYHGYAPASSERIIPALRHVEKVQTRRNREQALKAFAEAVGPRYAECTLENYRIEHDEAQRKVIDAIRDYAGHVAERVEAGVNVILFGPSGSGKDHLAVGLAREAILGDVHVAWRNGRDLFGAFRAAMDDDTSEDELLKPLLSATVLVISDPLPPSGPLTAYQQDVLYRAVDARYRLRKPVWLTLNVHNGREADERIGVPIVDRCRDGALVLKCDWPSYRRPLGQE